MHLGIYVISIHSRLRQMQRRVWESAFPYVRRGAHMWFVVPEKMGADTDVLATGTRSCIHNTISALRDARKRDYRHVVLTDDDVFLHVPRLIDEVSRLPYTQAVMYGQIGWAAGWDERRNRHYGYSNDNMTALVGQWHAEMTRQGPFPFAYGFLIALSRPLAGLVLDEPETRRVLQRARRSSHRCAPQSDAALGYLIARTEEVPIIYDVSSSGIVHFWRGLRTHQDVPDRLVVLHKATSWKLHFEWALAILRNQTGKYEYRHPYSCGPHKIRCGMAACDRLIGRYRGGMRCSADFARQTRFIRPRVS